ncbi:MAG: short-subunit dehydrogenase [Mariniblastus sp.]|jgi:short-subunit dehydrogenase
MSQTVLITGASSGIGLELAKLFAKSGHNLILVARREDKLRSLKEQLVNKHNVHIDVVVSDLAEVGAAEKLITEVNARQLVVDILVNNAGFGELGKFTDISTERQLSMVRLNVVTLMQLTRLLIPDMLQRQRGGVLNVGSTAAFQPGPNMAVYYATKAFVLSFSEAIHEELLDTNIKVTCLAPGPTKTGFGEDSGMGNKKIFSANAMDVAAVAKAGFDGFKANKAIVIPGFKNKLTAFANRLAPRFVVRKIVKRLQS